MKTLDHYWYSINPVSLILWPVSLFFLLLVICRKAFYTTGVFKSYKIKKPVVVIGNITVGGTGKTPLIIKLCELLNNWGYKTGVISRGYGGTGPWPHQLVSTSTAEGSGDEPLQVYNRTGVPVVVGPDRVADANYLLDNNELDIILTDDGLQHYRLQRDLELVVIDQSRLYGNGFLLPAGPLREPVSRMNTFKTACWKIVNGGNENYAFNIRLRNARQLSSDRDESLENFKSDTVHAVAGIGNPQRFFNMLKQAGLKIIEHPFPDHHQFSQQDLDFNDELPVLMTEKDSVKCQTFTRDNFWYVPIDIELTETFINAFQAKVAELVHG